MPRAYTFIIPSLSAITTTPFAQLATPATTAIEILRVELGQETSESSQQELMTFTRRTTNSTFPSVADRNRNAQRGPESLLTGSSTGNAYGVSTGTGSAGSQVGRFTFNALNGFLYLPVPEERITVEPSSFLTLEFPTAPAANTWSGIIVYQELS